MERSNRGKGRGSAQVQEATVNNRTINWSPIENFKLINATREVQVKFNRADIKFTPPQWQEVLEVFRSSGDFGHRCLDMVKNRLKVCRAEYDNIKDLLERSGWGWDSAKNIVQASNNEAWDELSKENKKWKSFSQKTFSWYDKFCEIIGNSATTGEFRESLILQVHSGTGSSDGVHAYDEPVHDSEERDRFEHQETLAQMEEDTVQQPLLAEAHNRGPPSSETGGANSARSRSSNKRKSTDTVEGSRSRCAKRSISHRQQNADNMPKVVRELVTTTSRLATVGEQFVDLQKKRYELPLDVIEALNASVLVPNDRMVAMRALEKRIEHQIFMCGGEEDRVSYLNNIILGFLQRNHGTAGQDPQTGGQVAQFSAFFNSGYFRGGTM